MIQTKIFLDYLWQCLVTSSALMGAVLILWVGLSRILQGRIQQRSLKFWARYQMAAALLLGFSISILNAFWMTPVFIRCLSTVNESEFRPVVFSFLIVWMIAIVFLALKDIYSFRKNSFLVRNLKPLDDGEINEMVQQLKSQLNFKKEVCLKMDEEGSGVFVSGVFNPTIILSRSVLNQLQKADLYRILAHEMAHIGDRDLLWKLICQFQTRIFFFNPLFYLFKNSYDLTVEKAADERAVERFSLQPSEMIQTLVQVCSIRKKTYDQANNLQISGHFLDIKKRMVALSELHHKKKLRCNAALAFGTLLSFLLGLQLAQAAVWKVPTAVPRYGMCLHQEHVDFITKINKPIKTEMTCHKGEL